MEEMTKKTETECKLNLKKARANKTPDWTEEEVKEVLKHLKTNVARNPLGYANELFNPKVAGKDLVKAIKNLLTRSKENNFYLNACNNERSLQYGNGRDRKTHSSFIEVYSEYVSSEMSLAY